MNSLLGTDALAGPLGLQSCNGVVVWKTECNQPLKINETKARNVGATESVLDQKLRFSQTASIKERYSYKKLSEQGIL